MCNYKGQYEQVSHFKVAVLADQLRSGVMSHSDLLLKKTKRQTPDRSKSTSSSWSIKEKTHTDKNTSPFGSVRLSECEKFYLWKVSTFIYSTTFHSLIPHFNVQCSSLNPTKQHSVTAASCSDRHNVMQSHVLA